MAAAEDATGKPSGRFPRESRLRTPAEFRAVYSHGKKAGDDCVLVIAKRNGMSRTRIGVSVSKKHGHAVSRNRKKRLLREAFRLERHALPHGLDAVLIPRQRNDLSLTDLRRSLLRLLRQLDRKLPAAADLPPEEGER